MKQKNILKKTLYCIIYKDNSQGSLGLLPIIFLIFFLIENYMKMYAIPLIIFLTLIIYIFVSKTYKWIDNKIKQKLWTIKQIKRNNINDKIKDILSSISALILFLFLILNFFDISFKLQLILFITYVLICIFVLITTIIQMKNIELSEE